MAVGGHTAGGGLTGEVRMDGFLHGQVFPADRALLPLCQSACDTGIAGGGGGGERMRGEDEQRGKILPTRSCVHTE